MGMHKKRLLDILGVAENVIGLDRVRIKTTKKGDHD